MGRQGRRANQGGGEKQLCFHKVHALIDFVV
jgi:hypothetical protein